MTEQNQFKPTEAELEILAVLWERETATVKEVHEQLNQRKPSGYTTVLKTMQIMAEKGFVRRETAGKAHVYTAAIEQAATQKRFAGDLMQKLFGGSAARLVMRVLETEPASQDELQQIRLMLDEAEQKAAEKAKNNV